MAATSGLARPIYPFKVTNNATGVATGDRKLEKATQTLLQGTPVQIDVAGATGYIIACPAMVSVATAIIAGFSQEPGHNLTTSGVGQALSTGAGVPNQSGASVIPIGAPPVDGTLGFWVALDETEFVAILGGSVTGNPALAVTMQGAIRGLTKDAGNNFWYVDNDITTVAAGACVEIIELIDAAGTVNGKVGVRVTGAAQQLRT